MNLHRHRPRARATQSVKPSDTETRNRRQTALHAASHRRKLSAVRGGGAASPTARGGLNPSARGGTVRPRVAGHRRNTPPQGAPRFDSRSHQGSFRHGMHRDSPGRSADSQLPELQLGSSCQLRRRIPTPPLCMPRQRTTPAGRLGGMTPRKRDTQHARPRTRPPHPPPAAQHRQRAATARCIPFAPVTKHPPAATVASGLPGEDTIDRHGRAQCIAQSCTAATAAGSAAAFTLPSTRLPRFPMLCVLCMLCVVRSARAAVTPCVSNNNRMRARCTFGGFERADRTFRQRHATSRYVTLYGCQTGLPRRLRQRRGRPW